MENIANKTVIITGASSGLGAETARHLVQNGAHVILGARRLDRLQQLADELGISHDHCVQTDVADLAQVQALAQRALDRTGLCMDGNRPHDNGGQFRTSMPAAAL